ncbi:C40 family peptidase [Heyndrickxia acidiproducens]|uniref:C40 family peptidase n=1 Tax=Heyndrickxia acidiproducens TaxID=1121084 RepID=UPI0004770623|nr:C40 family peptidase [Heyndrickxia acidiproducens]
MPNPAYCYINTSVATVWTAIEAAEGAGQEVLGNPAAIKKWLQQLTDKKRLELWSGNKIQTQALYGQTAIILSRNGDWAQVAIPDQLTAKNKLGYPGWVPFCQLKETAEPFDGDAYAVVDTPVAGLYDENQRRRFEISFQTRLPFLDEIDGWIKVKTLSGTGLVKKDAVQVIGGKRQPVPQRQNERILKAGKMFLGLPYLWGGISGFGYDCSGFAYTMVKAATGTIIPRDAGEQAQHGKEIPLSDIEPGDLLFFAHKKGKGAIHHVGIYAGEGDLLHSPKTGRNVEVLKMDGTIYGEELCCARRYWKP